MRKERATLKVSAIIANEGQLPWLPANPRQWTQTDIDRTRNSILEDPDFLEDRPLLVVPMPDGKTWLVFAGNLRREGAKSGKVKEVPCVIYYPENEDDYATIKRRAMKDNGSFGLWDYDELANSWDDLPLIDYGVPAWNFAKPKENTQKKTGEINVGDIHPTYEIHVECESLEQQLELIKELDGRGIKCKSL